MKFTSAFVLLLSAAPVVSAKKHPRTATRPIPQLVQGLGGSPVRAALREGRFRKPDEKETTSSPAPTSGGKPTPPPTPKFQPTPPPTPKVPPPTPPPSPSPTPGCTVCDDVATPYMTDQGRDCASSTNMDMKCQRPKWINNGTCRLSCYNSGNGYPGDWCCSLEEPEPTPSPVVPTPPPTPKFQPTPPPTSKVEEPEPTPSPVVPTPPGCTVCDDVATPFMTDRGIDCADSTNSHNLDTKCNKMAKWERNGTCRLSCFISGNGYPGDVCCLRGSSEDYYYYDSLGPAVDEPTPSPSTTGTVTPPPTPAPVTKGTDDSAKPKREPATAINEIRLDAKKVFKCHDGTDKCPWPTCELEKSVEYPVVEGMVTSPSGTYDVSYGDSGFFVKDGTGGIFVRTGGDNLGLKVGQMVVIEGAVTDCMAGTLALMDGEVTVDNSLDTVPDAPITFRPKQVGETTAGLPITVRGTAIADLADDGGYGYKLLINDGEGAAQVMFDISLDSVVSEIRDDLLVQGADLCVTGLVAYFTGVGWELLPRFGTDVREADPKLGDGCFGVKALGTTGVATMLRSSRNL